MGSLFKKNCSPSPPLGEGKGTCKLWVWKRLYLVFRHLSNRQLHFGGARLAQAVLALLVEGFTLTAAVFSRSGLGQYLCHQIFTSVCSGKRDEHLSTYSPLDKTVLAVRGYFLEVAGFLFVPPVVHPWISAEEPTVELHL